jgi:hypothetical protein
MMTPTHFLEPPLLPATPASGVSHLRLTQHGIDIMAPFAVRFRRADGACRPSVVIAGRRDPHPQRTVSNSATALASGPNPDAAHKSP